jgi:hypothetical protein
LAFWLKAAGFQPTLIESATAPRTGVFAPKTQLGLQLRNLVVKTFAIPGMARLTFGGDIIDTLRLPDYRCRRSRHG